MSDEAFSDWESPAAAYFEANYEASPTLDFEFVGSTYNGSGKWRGCCNDAFGNIWFSPYDSASVMRLDVSAGTTSLLDATAIYSGASKWVGMEHLTDGRIICNAYSANKLLVIDTGDSSLSGIASGYQARSSALDSSGNIVQPVWAYSPAATGDPNAVLPWFATVDVNTDTPSLDYWTPNRTGPAYAVSGWQLINASGSGVLERYWGAASAPNGKVYGIPYATDRILVMDSSAGTAVQGSDLLNAGSSPTDFEGHLNTTNSYPYWNKWCGAKYSPISGKIHAMPRRAPGMLHIDPFDDSATEDLSIAGESSNQSRSFGCVTGPDGRIYSVPWGTKQMFIFDPRTSITSVVDLSSILTIPNTGTSGNFFAGATLGPDGAIYFCPWGANRVMKLTVGSPSVPSANLILHRAMNSPL